MGAGVQVDVGADRLDVPAADGTADAMFVHPRGGGPHPGVLLYTDAYGLRPRIEEMARRLAGAGYAVLVPNVFYRHRRAPVLDDLDALMRSSDRALLFDQLRPMMAALTPPRVHADAGSWVRFLRDRGEVGQGPLGTVGYCLGGRLSLRTAGEVPNEVGAAASFHGGNLATDAEDSPHLAAVRSRGELYIGHADNDTSMPPGQMGRLTEALAGAHVRHTGELYVGAQHGWTMSDTAAWNEPAAERHWDRLLDLFRRTL
jgi:carboxymethylenebutenolidase